LRDLALANAMRAALRDAGGTPWTVGHIQAHGLGTRSVAGRALGLYRRSRVSQHVTPATIYEPAAEPRGKHHRVE